MRACIASAPPKISSTSSSENNCKSILHGQVAVLRRIKPFAPRCDAAAQISSAERLALRTISSSWAHDSNVAKSPSSPTPRRTSSMALCEYWTVLINQQRRFAGWSERAMARMRALRAIAVSACPAMCTRRSSRRRASCCDAAGGTRFCSRHSQGTSSATNGAYASRRLVLSAGCSRITLYVNLCRSSCSRWIRSWIASRAALIAFFSVKSSGAE
mmetsp:Transcript_10461/g.30831  ORF Transcript_10461/g.30831 Transcript_10461/m.30831 type:complete len:215 (+) Transcript_10461:1136-1780(+)